MGLQLYPRRLQERIIMDSQVDGDAFHPALVNAICLVACSCGGERMQTFEDVFLARTREYCAEALSFARQLDDFMTASVLQAVYLLRSGRMQEAYDLSSSRYSTITVRVRHALTSIEQPSAALQLPSNFIIKIIHKLSFLANLLCWDLPETLYMSQKEFACGGRSTTSHEHWLT